MKAILKRYRRSEGFTLVELLVSMLCTAIIMGAVLTWLLVGIRVEKSAADTMERQQKARVIISMLESMVNSGKITQVQKIKVESVADDEAPAEGSAGRDWALLDDAGQVLVRYRAGNGSIVSGSGTVLIDELDHSDAVLSDTQILTVSMTTAGEVYSKDIFFRVKPKEEKEYDRMAMLEEQESNTSIDANRIAFLTLVSKQVGSDGKIIDQSGSRYRFDYYTECYLYNTQNLDAWAADYSNEWNPGTPWCGTFVSWAMLHMNHECAPLTERVTLAYVPLFANVDDGRALFDENYVLGSGFTTGGLGATEIGKGNGKYVYGKDRPMQKVGQWIPAEDSTGNATIPTPGDLIFFDWDGDANKNETGEDGAHLEHVGIVYYITPDNGQVFTIEGNSDGKVAMRSYSLKDNAIAGYGVLDWQGYVE